MANDAFYFSYAWRQTRAEHLKQSPICVICQAIGLKTPATAVDHIRPIRRGGAPHEHNNLQSLCAQHHNSKTGTVDQGHRRRQTDFVVTGPDGWPVEHLTKRAKKK